MIVPFTKDSRGQQSQPLPMPSPTYLMMAAKLMERQGRIDTPPSDPASVDKVRKDMANASGS